MTRAMATLGTKWKPIIIYTIADRALRFGQISEQIPLISRKVLAEQLKELEEDQVVVRRAYHEIPPRVEYFLTEKGLALMPILKEVCQWNVKFAEKEADKVIA
jgi:DNA-binding HxlR family transcriptional regulator